MAEDRLTDATKKGGAHFPSLIEGGYPARFMMSGKNGEKTIYTVRTWNYAERQIGDCVDEEFITNMLDALPPACRRADCSQLGEPYSHRLDPETGRTRATYATFKAVAGEAPNRIWEYCGDCFRGENVCRGKNLPHM